MMLFQWHTDHRRFPIVRGLAPATTAPTARYDADIAELLLADVDGNATEITAVPVWLRPSPAVDPAAAAAIRIGVDVADDDRGAPPRPSPNRDPSPSPGPSRHSPSPGPNHRPNNRRANRHPIRRRASRLPSRLLAIRRHAIRRHPSRRHASRRRPLRRRGKRPPRPVRSRSRTSPQRARRPQARRLLSLQQTSASNSPLPRRAPVFATPLANACWKLCTIRVNSSRTVSFRAKN